MDSIELKILAPSQLQAIGDSLRSAGRIIVWTNGCFDLLHAGHVRSLRMARNLGDALVVGINSDESVRRLKGPDRPILPAGERAELIASLSCVCHVVVFDEDTPELCIECLRPDVFCKGAEYVPELGKPMPGAAQVEAYGGQVKYLPYFQGLSTTELIRRIQSAGI